MTKTAFAIFHVPGSERSELYDATRSTMLESFDELDTPTMYFKDSSDLEAFYNQNDIVFNRLGFFGTGWILGELGLWAGTYLALQNFLKSDYDYLMLMEDDLVLGPEFVDKLKLSFLELPDDWDTFFVHTAEHEKQAQISFKEHKPEVFLSNTIPGKTLISKAFQLISTACYIVNRESAKKIVEMANELISSPTDTFLLEYSGLQNYSLKAEVPSICWIEGNFNSQIQEGERNLFSFFAH